MVTIDVHCHTIPAAYLTEVEQVSRGSGPLAAFARQSLQRSGLRNDPQLRGALDERLRLMDAAGIDVQVISAGMPPSNFFEAESLAPMARLLNDETAGACDRFPGRYRFFACLPLPDVAASVAELRRAAALPGFAGVVIYTSFGLPLDDPALEPLYAALDQQRSLLFIHPTRMEAPGRFGRLGFETTLGWPVEDTLATLELILGGVLDRNPGVTVITPHLSGVALYQLARIDHGYHGLPPERRRAREAPSWYMRRMYHDSVCLWPPALQLARSAVGADHILLGSDFPYWSRDHLGDCVDVLDQLGWSPEELRLVRGATVERLLRERGLL